MKVELVAQTTVSPGAFTEMERDTSATDAEHLVEAAGRQCYTSFHKPNSKTRANRDYLTNILNQQHESVLEHASVSFRVSGVSRNLLLELERHRHLSFSVISQRYVDSSNASFITAPVMQEKLDTEIHDHLKGFIASAKWTYVKVYELLTEQGVPRKQAREAARSVLPGGIETVFVVTGNLRAWRDVLKKRYSFHADVEIRLLAEEILHQLRTTAPNVFQDFPEVPFS